MEILVRAGFGDPGPQGRSTHRGPAFGPESGHGPPQNVNYLGDRLKQPSSHYITLHGSLPGMLAGATISICPKRGQASFRL